MSGNADEKGATGWIVRAYDAGDRDEVLRLFDRVWGVDRGKLMQRIWHWKYECHPGAIRTGRCGYILEREGVVVGFVGALPYRFQFGLVTEEGVWGADHMVAPEFRGGPGIRLMRGLVNGERFVLGQMGKPLVRMWDRMVPSKRARLAILRRVWRKFGSKGRGLATARRVTSVLRQGGKGPGPAGEAVDKVVEGIVPEADRWLAPLLKTHSHIIWRDETMLQWRFDACPIGDHRCMTALGRGGPLGYLVLRVDPKVARIVDIVTAREHDEACLALMEEALGVAGRLGREGVELLEPLGGACRRVVERLGFGSPLRGDSETAVVFLTNDADLQRRGNGAPDDWHLVLADSDLDMHEDDA